MSAVRFDDRLTKLLQSRRVSQRMKSVSTRLDDETTVSSTRRPRRTVSVRPRCSGSSSRRAYSTISSSERTSGSEPTNDHRAAGGTHRARRLRRAAARRRSARARATQSTCVASGEVVVSRRALERGVIDNRGVNLPLNSGRSMIGRRIYYNHLF